MQNLNALLNKYTTQQKVILTITLVVGGLYLHGAVSAVYDKVQGVTPLGAMIMMQTQGNFISKAGYQKGLDFIK